MATPVTKGRRAQTCTERAATATHSFLRKARIEFGRWPHCDRCVTNLTFSGSTLRCQPPNGPQGQTRHIGRSRRAVNPGPRLTVLVGAQ